MSSDNQVGLVGCNATERKPTELHRESDRQIEKWERKYDQQTQKLSKRKN